MLSLFIVYVGVFGGLELHGRNISSTWTRLQTTVSAGEKVLTVDDGTKISEWRAGDKIVVTSSSHNMAEAEEAIIEVVDSDAGRITLKENLKYRHTGTMSSFNSLNVYIIIFLSSRV